MEAKTCCRQRRSKSFVFLTRAAVVESLACWRYRFSSFSHSPHALSQNLSRTHYHPHAHTLPHTRARTHCLSHTQTHTHTCMYCVCLRVLVCSLAHAHVATCEHYGNGSAERPQYMLLMMMVYVLSETYRASLIIPSWIHSNNNRAIEMQSKTSAHQKCLGFRGEGLGLG